MGSRRFTLPLIRIATRTKINVYDVLKVLKTRHEEKERVLKIIVEKQID